MVCRATNQTEGNQMTEYRTDIFKTNHPAVRSKLMTTQDHGLFEAALSETFEEAKALLMKKHLDYGPRNIADAPGGALNGLRVRMHDKTARINHLIDNAADPENESLRDSYLDLLNYAAIGLMVLDGNWPSE